MKPTDVDPVYEMRVACTLKGRISLDIADEQIPFTGVYFSANMNLNRRLYYGLHELGVTTMIEQSI